MSLFADIRSGIRNGLRAGLNPGDRLDPIPTLLTSGSSTTDGASVETDSVAPLANGVVFAIISSINVGGTVEPTCTGNDLTWELVATKQNASAARRLTIFRALGAAPTEGVITFDFGVEDTDSFIWSVVQFADADTSGTSGSGAVVQVVEFLNDASVTTFTNTLDALEHSSNVHLCIVATAGNRTVTPDADFTELSDDQVTTIDGGLETQWARNQVACTPTFLAVGVTAISIEVKAG